MYNISLSSCKDIYFRNSYSINLRREQFLIRLKKGLIKTRDKLGYGFIDFFKKKKIDRSFFKELENLLLLADVGVVTTNRIISRLMKRSISFNDIQTADFLYSELRKEMSIILEHVDTPLCVDNKQPFIILIVGVNGVGKTTTVGKLAYILNKISLKKVMIVAADTYRVAAVDQLKLWGQYSDVPVVCRDNCTDSAAIVFDGVKSAKDNSIDVLIIDTAGRLQNKDHLIYEMKKIVKVLKKMNLNYPHEVMLIIDASTGQNAISQVAFFNNFIKVTGITITKFDSSAKGGIIFAISDQFRIPVRYIGVGEHIEDLQMFDLNNFIKVLFDI